MKFKKFTDRLKNNSEEIRFYRMVIVGLILLVVLMAMTIKQSIGNSRTVITPPQLTKEFWVSGSDVSQDYLEQMAYWYTGLALNITPQVSKYQNDLFLKYADPASSGRLAAEAGARAEFLNKNNAATVFSTRTIAADMPTKRVAVTGTLTTYVADKRVSERNATYMIGFNYINGQLYVSDFKETNAQDPFGIGSASVQ